MLLYLIIFSLIIQSFASFTHGAPPSPLTEHTTRSFRNALNQQGFQSILQSIEERLRNLDQIYAIRYSRSDLNKDQYARRLDLLETKLTRIESLMEVQTEKLAENMSSKNFKDDITKDQLFRKIDSIYERINHKLSYIEGKADMDTLKLQSKIEGALSKVERLDHFIGVRQADIEAELADGVEMIETIRNSVNSIENKVINITKFQEQISQNVENAIVKLEKKLNNSYNHCQKDSPNVVNVKKISEYEMKINNYENKITNMYNDLWKKSINIENSIEKSIEITNLTSKEIYGKINNILLNKHLPNENQNDGNLEIILDSFTITNQRKFVDLGRKMEENFQNVMLAQNLFLESCHRIQLDEAQLENKIGLVLEKLLDSFTNKTASTFKEIQAMKDMLKSHNSNVYRSLNQNTNNLIKLSEKGSEGRKKLEKTLLTMKTDMGNSLNIIYDMIASENEGGNQKLELVTNILQELQDQVNDLDNRMTEDNATYNSKQILQDIMLEMEMLNNATFTKRVNGNLFENMTSLTTIENIIAEIYQILTTIDNKLNNTSMDQYKGDNKKSTLENVNESIEVILFPDTKFNFEINKQNYTTPFLNRFNYTLIKNETIQRNHSFKVEKEKNGTHALSETPIMGLKLSQAGINGLLVPSNNVTDPPFTEHFNTSVNHTQSPDSFEYTDLKFNPNDKYLIKRKNVIDLPLQENVTGLPFLENVNASVNHTQSKNNFEYTDYKNTFKKMFSIDSKNVTDLPLVKHFNASMKHTQSQDSFEYTDFKNNPNEDGFIEEITDLPDKDEYYDYENNPGSG